MINFSTSIQNLLKEPVVESFWLIRIGDDYFTTSFYTDITVDGQEYLADGALLQVDPPQMGSSVDRQMFKITLVDNGMVLGAPAEEGLTGTKVEARLGFVDQVTKQPLLSLAETILVYKGAIDSTAYSISLEKVGSSAFSISCTSPMYDLERTKAYYTSQDYLDKNYPGDNSYEQLYEGAGPISLRWGKQ